MTLTDKQTNAGTSAPRGTIEDSFRILLATDIHLGYGEKEANIGKKNSSGKECKIVKFNTFRQ